MPSTVPQHLPFSIGRGVNSAATPHLVQRPNGSDVWVLECTVSGSGRIHAGARQFRAEPGDLLLYRPRTPQWYGMDAETGSWDHLWACFTPRPAWKELLNWPEAAPGILRLSLSEGELRQRIRRRLEKAIELAAGPLQRKADFAMNILEEVFLWCDTVNPANRQAMLDGRIRQAQELICANSHKRLTLRELATAACLSPSRFSHLFKEQTGETPIQYLERQRMTRASELLLLTDRTVKSVADETGFQNPFYFTRVFTRHFGASPSTYRGGIRR